MPRILVCGDRKWTDEWAIRRELWRRMESEPTIIHGAARGADSIAGEIAGRLGLAVLAFPAQWEKYGKAAGPIRNKQMLDEGKPNLVLAFHKNLAASKGTADMVRQARKRGIPVEVFTE